MQNIFINNKGFTLIEVLVSTSVIVIISGIFLVNYNGANDNFELSTQIQEIESQVRAMQNNSLAGLTNNNDFINWGIHFQKGANTYTIFRDNDDYLYDVDEKYRDINLPRGMTISNISLDDNFLDLVFEAPHAKTYMNTAPGHDVQIELLYKGRTETIEINSFGLVDILDN